MSMLSRERDFCLDLGVNFQPDLNLVGLGFFFSFYFFANIGKRLPFAVKRLTVGLRFSFNNPNKMFCEYMYIYINIINGKSQV